ncbi:MAG: hypothetical protein P8X53_13815 [Chromatiales bacterium]|jgi:hypothetical protein
MRTLLRIAAALLIGTLLLPGPGMAGGGQSSAGRPLKCPTEREDCHFTVLTIPFESDDAGELGRNVSLTIQHQIFRNFLLSLPAEPEDICCLPNDTIAWLAWGQLSEQDHEEAIRRATETGSTQLVLWGKAWPWREFVVVQPYLSIVGPPRGLDPQVRICCTNTRGIDRIRPFTKDGAWRIWEIAEDDANGGARKLYIDRFPRELYDLPQISLDARDVEQFRSLAGLPVRENDNGKIGGLLDGVTTGSSIKALQHVGEYTLIDEPRGWIKLPVVDAGQIVEFIGGLMHFLRGNWERARTSFEAVAQDETASSSVRVDAALLLAATEYRLDASCGGCRNAIDIAKGINPYSATTARFELMARIAQGGAGNEAATLLVELAENRALYPPEDPFTQRAAEYLRETAP